MWQVIAHIRVRGRASVSAVGAPALTVFDLARLRIFDFCYLILLRRNLLSSEDEKIQTACFDVSLRT